MFLVTGGVGFIGSNLVAALSDRGAEVAVCDRFGQDERWKNIAKHEIADFVAPDELCAWLKRAPKIDAVIHLGANSSTTEKDVDHIVAANIRPTLALWQWCTQTKTPFVYASSAATYGDGEQGFTDDESRAYLAKLRPLNAYGWSKLVFDRRVARLVSEGAARPPQWAGLKFFNVYGPNEYHKGMMRSVVAQNFARVRDGESIRLFKSERPDFADGGQKRDFIYVRDCVDVILWLLDNPKVSGLFNIGTGLAHSWLDLANAFFGALNLPPRIEFVPKPAEISHRYQYFTEARMTKLRAAGYSKAFTTLEDGVSDYVKRYLSNSDPYR
ncbi:MAG: ADP-glyceromanno-heptose 6-epimerase [Proteobacteria bacterium]|nr:ADP-glyceromanno-heptose 6-epimerase [Pseudomonadota bacterium]